MSKPRLERNFSRKFVAFLKANEITLSPTGKGNAGMYDKNGRFVASMSTTAKPGQAEKAAIRKLVSRGVLPKSALRERFS